MMSEPDPSIKAELSHRLGVDDLVSMTSSWFFLLGDRWILLCCVIVHAKWISGLGKLKIQNILALPLFRFVWL